MNKKVLVGMSGGVDSSVCAYLLKADGYEPTGVNCRFFDNDDAFITDKTCCSLEDANDARNVAYKLGIPFYVFNFTEDFRKCVIENFVETYMNAATPNPCIECNRRLKFDKLLKRAAELEHDYVATGHYARIETDPVSGRKLLKKGIDTKKDQSYVLYMLNQFQLAHTLFPLGGYTKTQIREIAEEQGFLNSKKHESQDICFIPDGDYAAFIEKHTGKTFPEGEFVTEDGKVLGTHKGIIRYTIGQRKGLGLALPCPMYVKEKNLEENKVVLCLNEDLFSKELYADDFNWLSIPQPTDKVRCKARIRYNQKEQPAFAEVIENGKVKVVFDEPQRAICKGQAVVLYDGDVVLGGGTIL